MKYIESTLHTLYTEIWRFSQGKVPCDVFKFMAALATFKIKQHFCLKEWPSDYGYSYMDIWKTFSKKNNEVRHLKKKQIIAIVASDTI